MAEILVDSPICDDSNRGKLTIDGNTCVIPTLTVGAEFFQNHQIICIYIYKTLITCAYLCITSEHFSGAWKPAEMCRFQSTHLGANMWADSAFPHEPPGGTPCPGSVRNVPR